MSRTLASSLLALTLIAGSPMAFADKPPVYTGLLSDLAADGHDVVAYFKEGAPTLGSSAYETAYKGATWRFASASNLAAFKADPDAYAPQYGGYCAWAVSQGYTAKGDPQRWKIVDGKLYLNYDANIQKRWERDIPGLVRAGDANWPAVLAK